MNKIKYIFLLFVSFSILSCDEMLETDPSTSIDFDKVLKKPSLVESALMGAYNSLQGYGYYGRDFIVSCEALADNLELTEKNSGRFDEQIENETGYHIGNWGNSYDVITRCNNVIYAVYNTLEGATENQEKQFLAEALFLRALAYHDLLRVYSREPNYLVDNFDLGVPIVLEPFDINGKNVYPKRETVSDCYIQVVNDLDDCIEEFKDLENISFPYRASAKAAKALLSRVYLYQENWGAAISYSEELIGDNTNNLTGGDVYRNIFSQDSESIFSLFFATNESHKYNSLQSIYTEVLNSDVGYGDLIPSEDFMDKISNNDTRKSIFRNAVKGDQNVTYQEKFNGFVGTFGADNIALIRYSEVYLNLLEALTERGLDPDIAKAKNLLIKFKLLRNKHVFINGSAIDLNALSPDQVTQEITDQVNALTKSDLLKEILIERRIELAFEGHRFFDLKRKGYDISKPDDDDNLDWDDYKVVGKISTTQIDINDNLDQNPKY